MVNIWEMASGEKLLALQGHSAAYILDDDEIAILYPGKVEIFDVLTGEKRGREPITVQWSIDAAQKVLDDSSVEVAAYHDLA